MTPLVVNGLGGGHTDTQTQTYTHARTHANTHSHRRANQTRPGLKIIYKQYVLAN